MLNRTIQIKLLKDTPTPTYSRITSPQNPEETPEAKVNEVIQNTAGCIVVGYTVCKSVNFFYRMAEHYLVR